jgi:hypothetical protein
MRLKLRDLDADAKYKIGPIGSEETATASGRELMSDGLRVSLPDKPAAAVLVYRCAGN